MTALTLPSGFKVVLRPMEAGDHNFVLNSWLKSYRKAPANFGLKDQLYYEIQTEVVTGLLERAEVLIAGTEKEILATTDPATGQIVKADFDPIAGWICTERRSLKSQDDSAIIHYCYVKYPFRQLGIANALCRHTDLEGVEKLFLSHITHSPWVEGMFRKFGPKLAYYPTLKRAA